MRCKTLLCSNHVATWVPSGYGWQRNAAQSELGELDLTMTVDATKEAIRKAVNEVCVCLQCLRDV